MPRLDLKIKERQKKAYIDYVGSYVCIDEEGYIFIKGRKI